MPRLRGQLPAVLLLTLGTVLGLALLEAGARVAAVREERRQGRLDRDLAGLKGPGPGSTVTLGQLIRKSDHPRIVYELRPRLDVRFAGGHLTTSDAGFRGRDVSVPKPPGVYRIVGLGDSYMFGQGVSDDDTYLARLEPDLILIEIVGNDLDLPNFLWSAVDPWTLRRSFLFDFVRDRLGAGQTRASSAPGLGEAPHEGEGAKETFARDAARVPPQYASMVGLKAFEKAVEDLAAAARERRIPVLALTHGVWFEDAMLKALAENEIPVLVLRNPLRQRARALGAPDYARSPLATSPADLHPSALGYRVIAEELSGWLQAQLALRPGY